MWFITLTVCLLGLCGGIAEVLSENGNYAQGTVYMKNGKATLKLGTLDKQHGTAYGVYNNTLLTSGWGILDLKAGYGDDKPSNNDIMYAAGYLEGVFTGKQIWQNYQNLRGFFFAAKPKVVEKKVKEFFNSQDKWMRDMISKMKGNDPFWRHVSYIVSQYDGLIAGYKAVAQPEWDSDAFVIQVLNGVGDLLDLVRAVSPRDRPDISKMTKEELTLYVARHGHCSALIKILGAYEDLFMSHSSWFSYSATSRIYKYYDFNVNDAKSAAKKTSFSSYPGFLESLDDFYLLGSDMVMLQTTNNVFDMTLYKYVKPESLFAWHRVRVANMMANSGSQWAKTVQRYNSGTYNNQYMVIDLKQINLGQSIKDDALWVVEQIPGTVVSGDQTPILRTGYWPSYNVPFYEEIYNKSGYPAVVAQKGVDFSYQLAPRAKIFRRDSGKVVDMESMKAIMRYNDYKHDKYSEGNPCNTICCRGDLNPSHASPMGCYDTKVSDYKMAKQNSAYIINGPTLGTGLTPFSWTGKFANMSHIGLPKVYDFDWVTAKPIL